MGNFVHFCITCGDNITIFAPNVVQNSARNTKIYKIVIDFDTKFFLRCLD
jgi:hypothetical protein